jgi:hypothetical protein
MQTEIDEVDNNRHMKMYMIEFIEALSRVADKLNIIKMKKLVIDP